MANISKIFRMVSLLFHLTFILAIHGNILLEGLSLLLFLLFVLLLFLFSHHFLKYFRIVVVDVLVYSCLQSLHQLLFDFLFYVRSDQGLGLSYSITFLSFLFNWHKLLLSLHLHFPHLNEHLPELCQSLLAFVYYKRRPIDKVLIYLLEGFLIVFIQFYPFPQLIWQMRPFSCFHVQVADALLFFDCGILGIGQRTGATIAQASQIILVFAEVLGISFHAK